MGGLPGSCPGKRKKQRYKQERRERVNVERRERQHRERTKQEKYEPGQPGLRCAKRVKRKVVWHALKERSLRRPAAAEQLLAYRFDAGPLL